MALEWPPWLHDPSYYEYRAGQLNLLFPPQSQSESPSHVPAQQQDVQLGAQGIATPLVEAPASPLSFSEATENQASEAPVGCGGTSPPYAFPPEQDAEPMEVERQASPVPDTDDPDADTEMEILETPNIPFLTALNNKLKLRLGAVQAAVGAREHAHNPWEWLNVCTESPQSDGVCQFLRLLMWQQTKLSLSDSSKFVEFASFGNCTQSSCCTTE